MASNAVQIPNESSGTKFVVLNDPERQRTAPYMKRGTTWRGHHFGHIKLSLIFFLGCVIILLSVAYSALSYKTLVMLPVGIFIIVLYLCLVRIAKREFDALPLDHPDRLKYVDVPHLPSSSTPSSSLPDVPLNPAPHNPPYPDAPKYDFPMSSSPHSPRHSEQDPSACPPGHPHPQGQDRSTLPQGHHPYPQEQDLQANNPYLPVQGNTQGLSIPSPACPPSVNSNDEPPPYSEI